MNRTFAEQHGPYTINRLSDVPPGYACAIVAHCPNTEGTDTPEWEFVYPHGSSVFACTEHIITKIFEVTKPGGGW